MNPKFTKPRNDVLLLFFASLDIYDQRSDFDFSADFLNSAGTDVEIDSRLTGDLTQDWLVGGFPAEAQDVCSALAGPLDHLLFTACIRSHQVGEKLFGNIALGLGEDVRYRSFFDDPAVIEDRYKVAHIPHHLHLVGDHHDRKAHLPLNLFQ